MKNMKDIGISLGVTVVLGFIVNYFALPAWNYKSLGFWFYIFFLLIVFAMSITFSAEINKTKVLKQISSSAWLIIGLLFIFVVISMFLGSKLIRSKAYANMIENNFVEQDFSTYEANVNNVPLLDKNSAMLIANRKLGSLEDVISQFDISNTEQITVKGKPVRVAILGYAGFFKWVNNRQEGTPGYIMVDMKSQDADLVRVEGGIKYSPSEFLGRDLKRYLRMNYPKLMFDEPTLELNEEGHPYWIAPIIDHTIGLFGGKDISGAVLVDAVTGDLERYKVGEVPDWLDNIYPSNLIIEQYDNYGSYQKGFWNSIIGQKGVKVTTDGYNYIPQGNDNWIYTGITSVVSDESNIGFILVNKRTKEYIYYSISGAEEYSAMSSAQGVVQHLGYTSTFPLLLTIEGQPTYLVALKDAGGLVKMYGMVNVEKYQIVATGETIESCQKKYRELLKNSGSDIKLETDIVKGRVEVIKEAIKEGTTYYYIKLEQSKTYYVLSILENEEIVLLDVGDSVSLEVVQEDNANIVPALLVD